MSGSTLPVDLGVLQEWLGVLQEWMDASGLGSGPLGSVELLAGGTQNVLVRFERDGASYVLRRGPEHLRPESNDAMRREMRVLAALAGTEVPHPRLIKACPDESVLGGAAFYLMEQVTGVNPTVELAPVHLASAEVRHEMGLQAVDAIAALGAVDYVAVGLGDLGHPEGFLDRQVSRWRAELEKYSRHKQYPGPSIPGLEDVTAWLTSNQPLEFQPGLLHGDYHFGNLMYRCDGPKLAAVIDWEMCTVGDPLLDFGWLLATLPETPEDNNLGLFGELPGLPEPEELVERYRERSPRDLSSVMWYETLACFKLGIILEGTYARAFAGEAALEVGERLHRITLNLFDRARRRIEGT